MCWFFWWVGWCIRLRIFWWDFLCMVNMGLVCMCCWLCCVVRIWWVCDFGCWLCFIWLWGFLCCSWCFFLCFCVWVILCVWVFCWLIVGLLRMLWCDCLWSGVMSLVVFRMIVCWDWFCWSCWVVFLMWFLYWVFVICYDGWVVGVVCGNLLCWVVFWFWWMVGLFWFIFCCVVCMFWWMCLCFWCLCWNVGSWSCICIVRLLVLDGLWCSDSICGCFLLWVFSCFFWWCWFVWWFLCLVGCVVVGMVLFWCVFVWNWLVVCLWGRWRLGLWDFWCVLILGCVCSDWIFCLCVWWILVGLLGCRFSCGMGIWCCWLSFYFCCIGVCCGDGICCGMCGLLCCCCVWLGLNCCLVLWLCSCLVWECLVWLLFGFSVGGKLFLCWVWRCFCLCRMVCWGCVFFCVVWLMYECLLIFLLFVLDFLYFWVFVDRY